MATLAAGGLVSGLWSPVSAQTAGAPERYNATAVNMGSGPSFSGRVLIAVTRWTTPSKIEPVRLTEVRIEK